ncbi:hypothetical protein BKA66DRAFT_512303 [Pyrenochaeta sp. MPI-SDFR-AT-0127]|nr:hypothetical protein BKA66DRAFT_512303 [Pyrenochaeta sp. MPI-SDFR-AT-0127]
MPPDADAIADCVLSTFDRLPEKRKPRPRNDGSREWVPLAGIVLSKAVGNILHDWHAEVLAIRAFNRFLLDQYLLISTAPYPDSDFLQQRIARERSEHELQPFTIKDDVQIHMYCSEAPCGDASMELVMDAQEDATPWTSAPPTIPMSSQGTGPSEQGVGALRGRSNFSLLGAVRCKPSRPDAPPTLTCERAFSRSGRLTGLANSLTDSWKGGYRFQSFEVKPTSREFVWSRRSLAQGERAVASNLSAVWTPSWQETLIGGVLQGRKQLDARGASKICRSGMCKIAMQIVGTVGIPLLIEALGKGTYREMKEAKALEDRRKVKHDIRENGLNGWVRNTGDDGFSLDDTSQA